MKIIFSLFTILCLTSCNTHIKDQEKTEIEAPSNIQAEIDALLQKDKENKKLELEYLEQIRIAQDNNDTEAFEFFLQEYFNVERLEIPEELKKEPNYFKGGEKVKY
jgi:hypothetical protein